MKYNILIGGAAGQGMKTLANLLSKALKRHGYYVFVNTVYMSRIRGGHNYFQIRFSDKILNTHNNDLDLILALNQETIDIHENRLLEKGLVLCTQKLNTHQDKVAIDIKQNSHPKSENIILLGALCALFNLDKTIFNTIITESFNSEFSQTNLDAFANGQSQVKQRFLTVPLQDDHHIILNGNTSLALGAITAGMSVFSAYPMTPATSIMNYLIKKQTEAGFVIEQAEDEIAAIHIALGASAAGVRAMTASSGGGLSLMVEALGLVAITETPLVIVDVMRPGPATGLPTKTGQSDLSFLLNASQDEFPRMIIAVRNVSDAFYQTIRAFDLAEKYQIPVIILSDQYLADSSMTVPKFDFNIEINRHLADESQVDVPYQRYKFTESGVSPRLLPGFSAQPIIADNHEHDPYGKISEEPENRTQMHLKRLNKLNSLMTDIQEPIYIGSEDADTVLVGFGSVWGPISESIDALNLEGKKIAGLIFGDVYPLPLKTLNKVKDKNLINVEMNATGQLARLIRMETGITFTDQILKFDGLQITSKEIKEVLDGKL